MIEFDFHLFYQFKNNLVYNSKNTNGQQTNLKISVVLIKNVRLSSLDDK